jgi:hypothetical protein
LDEQSPEPKGRGAQHQARVSEISMDREPHGYQHNVSAGNRHGNSDMSLLRQNEEMLKGPGRANKNRNAHFNQS